MKKNSVNEALGLIVEVLELEFENNKPFNAVLVEQVEGILILFENRLTGYLSDEEQEIYESLSTDYELATSEIEDESEDEEDELDLPEIEEVVEQEVNEEEEEVI